MTKEEILQTIRLLANNQGFYSGLMRFLMEDSNESEEYINMLVNKQFKDPGALIKYFEE